MLFRALEEFVLVFLLISSFADHVSASVITNVPRSTSKSIKPIRAYDFKNIGNCLSASSDLKYCSYDGGLMSHHEASGQKKHVVSFIHKETAVSVPGHHLKQQLDNGVVERDWQDTLDNSWAVYILKAAAVPVAGGIFVKALDFAYGAIRGSTALADAWNAAQPYAMYFAAGAQSLLSRGLARFGYNTALPGPGGGRKRNCENGDTYSYVDPGSNCAYWMNPTVDPNGGNFPSDDVLNQFSADFGNHMQGMGEDDAEGGISPASYTGSDPGHNEVLGAGVSCGNTQEREVDEC